jgi:hypothetical protein
VTKRKHLFIGGFTLIAVGWIAASLLFQLWPVGSIYLGASLISCRAHLRLIETAKQVLQHEKGLHEGDEMSVGMLQQYFGGRVPRCPGGGDYDYGEVGEVPTCSYAGGPGPSPRKRLVWIVGWAWNVPPSGPHDY